MRNPFRRKLKADQVVQPMITTGLAELMPHGEFLSVSTENLRNHIGEYVAIIETKPTRETCYCEWVTHPADVDLPRHKQRAQLKEHHDWCPVHEKQGFLLGFFVYMFGNQVPSGRQD